MFGPYLDGNVHVVVNRFLKTAAVVAQDHPVVVSKYIENAKEVEMDAVGCAGKVSGQFHIGMASRC